jgi:hypothetical protein
MEHVTYFQGYRPAETAAGAANQRLIANVHPPDWQNPKPAVNTILSSSAAVLRAWSRPSARPGWAPKWR